MIGTDGMSSHIRSGLASGRNSIELQTVADDGPGRSLAAGISEGIIRVGCIIALIVAFPVMLLAGFAVLATSAGPTMTRSPSIGADGRVRFLRRFRTTYRACGEQETTAGSGDITPIGRLLKLSGIVRLPALMDVWMSRAGLIAASGR